MGNDVLHYIFFFALTWHMAALFLQCNNNNKEAIVANIKSNSF